MKYLQMIIDQGNTYSDVFIAFLSLSSSVAVYFVYPRARTLTPNFLISSLSLISVVKS